MRTLPLTILLAATSCIIFQNAALGLDDWDDAVDIAYHRRSDGYETIATAAEEALRRENIGVTTMYYVIRV